MEIYLETIDKNGFAYNFLTNPATAVGEDVNLYGIRLYGDENNDEVAVEETINDDVENRDNSSDKDELPKKSKSIGTIASGEDVKDIIFREALFDVENYSKELNKWQYIPFNFRQKERLNQLYKALNSEFKRNISDDELVNLWRTGSADDTKK